METIYEQFSDIEIDKFIFTKLDETMNYVNYLRLSCKCEKGIAYISKWERCPNDIVEASKEYIMKIKLQSEWTYDE